jgi:hypothetical protein
MRTWYFLIGHFEFEVYNILYVLITVYFVEMGLCISFTTNNLLVVSLPRLHR